MTFQSIAKTQQKDWGIKIQKIFQEIMLKNRTMKYGEKDKKI